jgi:hypothetical protein
MAHTAIEMTFVPTPGRTLLLNAAVTFIGAAADAGG